MTDKDPTDEEVDAAIQNLAARVRFAQPITVETDRVATFAAPRARTAWSTGKGLYYFETAGMVKYLGRAIGSTLGERLRSQCTSRDDKRWDAVLDHPETRIKAFVFPTDEWYWAAAIEAYLIHRFRFPINKRVS